MRFNGCTMVHLAGVEGGPPDGFGWLQGRSLLVVGVSQSFTMVTMSVLLLGVTSPELRGRVMGLRSLAVYGLPIGLLASGAVAERFGAPMAFLINGGAGIILTVAIATRLKGLWRAS